MKRFIQLSLLMLAILLPVTVTAHDFEVDGIYYNINGTEATVTYKGTGYDSFSNEYTGDVTIPCTVTYKGETYSVISIGEYAFYNCSGLTSIDIPNSIISIGNRAFTYCSGLTSVTIPNSVTSIGEHALSYCYGLTNVTIPNSVTSIGNGAFTYSSSLTSIDIPNSVTTIGEDVFSDCGSLTSVTIPNSVTTIGECAFRGCGDLTSVTIPNSVTSIGNGAFAFCSGLTSVTIPNSVTSIGEYAFEGCSGLTNIEVTNGNTIYDSRDNCNAIIETASNRLIAGCQSTDIPNSVTSIGECAFYDCSGLTDVTIPNSVTSIGGYAFYGCSGLTSVTIPNSVTSIGNGAFFICSSLTSIDISNSVTSIGGSAFEGCEGLNDVYCYIINPSIISMGSSVFYLYTGNYGNRTLHVPDGTVSIYQADTKWSKFFGSIVEMEPEAVLAESIKLNVTTAGLNEDSSLQLTVTVLPENCDKTVIWASNNPSIATVDSNGLVTTHGIGTATITAVTTDGSNLSTSCTVTLLPVGVKGDVNGDNKISIDDVATLINYLLNSTWN